VLRLVPIAALTRTAAAVMLVLAAITLISAIHGPALHSAARYLPRTTNRSRIVPIRCPMAVTDSEGPAVQPSRVSAGGQVNCRCQCQSQAR